MLKYDWILNIIIIFRSRFFLFRFFKVCIFYKQEIIFSINIKLNISSKEAMFYMPAWFFRNNVFPMHANFMCTASEILKYRRKKFSVAYESLKSIVGKNFGSWLKWEDFVEWNWILATSDRQNYFHFGEKFFRNIKNKIELFHYLTKISSLRGCWESD
jgi:hypothetical protein